jgi:hypothetical protein
MRSHTITVIAPGALAIHADRDLVLSQDIREGGGSELAALVGVDDLRSAIAGQRLLTSLDAEGCLQGDRQPPNTRSLGPSGCR